MKAGAPMLALAVALASPARAAGGEPAGATAVLVLGNAEVIKRGAKAGGPLAQGKTVAEGDTVKTAAGARVELELPDHSRIRVGPSSEVELDQSRFSGKARESVSFKVSLGRIWATVAKAVSKDSTFEVRTKNAVSGVRGTSFTVLAAQDASAIVRVYAGTVGVRKADGGGPTGPRKQIPGPKQIDQRQWEEIIATGMKQVKISALGDLAPAEDFVDAGEDLEWAQWNQSRNKEAGVPD